ncbi:hypothetical protein [Oceanimonas sp. MB9]|uniref:hypothetical protein n=1 Tax=Oceanimonas sp. MB9 TaxID=2588453 RepID=UPI003519DBE5
MARLHQPCVVLVGSGMCSGGRIINYLKALLNDSRNDACLCVIRPRGCWGAISWPMAQKEAGWSWMVSVSPFVSGCTR